ncbi:MAG: HlyD family efflux transporter periplasmic adaptor subunit [Planctomycetota bacterium]
MSKTALYVARPHVRSRVGRARLAVGSLTMWLALAALTGCSDAADGSTGNAANEWYEARAQSFDLTIAETGQLEAAERVDVKSKVDGRPAILQVVDEGVHVEAGDLLVQLDAAEIEQKLEEAELKLETARADRIAADQDLQIQETTARSTQRAAEVAKQLAELELAEWEQGAVPTEERKLNLALEKAQREVERTERNFETDQELYAQRFISQDELEDSEIAKIEAIDALATANLDIEVYQAYTLEKERQEKMSALDDAVSELSNTIAENESKLAQARAKAVSRQRGEAIQERRVAELREQLAATTLNAPTAGMVVYASSTGSRWNRSEPIAEGRQVRNGETVIYLPDPTQLVAVLSVPEALAPQVVPGQRAEVAVDAIPGRVFPATIESVSVLAADGGWWNNNVKNFTVRALLEPNAGEGQLKPTMTCTGTIFTGRVEDAVAVPVQAIFADGEQRFVYVTAGLGGVERQDVEIGRASETLVEVVSGLDAGTDVLLRAPHPGEEVAG